MGVYDYLENLLIDSMTEPQIELYIEMEVKKEEE